VRVHDLNWMQLEPYLEGDNRIVLPLGSSEQTGSLSASTQEPPTRFLEQRE
jgi:creatinine amidohydrolase